MAELDKLDIKILRELVQGEEYFLLTDFRRSLRRIGKKFSIDEHTVKNRIARLRQSGLWQGWLVSLHADLVSRTNIELSFDVPPDSKDDLISKLKLVEDAMVIHNYYGSLISIFLFSEGEYSLKNQIELIAKISKTEDIVVAKGRLPKCEINLSKTDWEIVKIVHRNPKKSYTEVSKELGLSTATIKRRLAMLIEGKAVLAILRNNLKIFRGAIPADLRVFYDSPESRGKLVQKIISQLDDYLYFAGIIWDVLGVFRLIVPNVSKMQEIVKQVKQHQGVRNARIDILQERIVLDEKFARVIEKKLAQIQLANV